MQVYTHTPHSLPLQKALKSHLPYSIPLVYRTQHVNTQTASTYILSTIPTDTPITEIPKCWAAAYLDRSVRPETELWMFASGEVPGHYIPPNATENGEAEQKRQDPNTPTPFCPTCTTLVHHLLAHISTLPIPPMAPTNLHTLEKARHHALQYPETGPNVRYPPEPGSYLRHLLDPSVLTLGSVHHQIARICLDMGIVRREFPGLEAELNTFVFKVENLPQTRGLPEGLRWGRMREQDMEVVQARTSIPRPKKTLLALESVGVFEEKTDKAVAWAFLGVDGSLTTLHTEPEYRGKGIAKAVAARIFREYAPGLALDDEGTAWAYGNVYAGNVQSEAVCRSLGGEPLWKTFWIRIGLEKSKA